MKSDVRNHKVMRFPAIWDLKGVKAVSRGMFLNRVGFRVVGSDVRVEKLTGTLKKTL